jgi:hypothetical protein
MAMENGGITPAAFKQYEVVETRRVGDGDGRACVSLSAAIAAHFCILIILSSLWIEIVS